MSELTPDKQVNLSIAQPSVLSADARGLTIEKSLDQEIPDEVPAQAATRSLKELLDPDNSAQQKHWLQMVTVGLLFLGIISGAIVALTKSNDPNGQSAITQDLNSKIKEQQGNIQADSALHINLDTIIEGGKEFTTTGRLVLKNSVNSTTAFLIQNASGNNLMSADTANNRIEINGLLAVEGNITSGGQLVAGNSSLDTQSLRINNVVICDATGCIPSPAATGSVDLSNLNASNITSGTLNDARLSGSVTLQGNIFNGPNQLVQLDGSGKLPTGLFGSDAASLSANQTFTGQNIFRPATNAVSAFQIQNAAGTSNLFIADTVNNRLGIGTNSPSATLSVVGTGLIQQSSTAAPALAVSGNEITDASRALAIQGDGRTIPDSSFGIWQGSTNQVNNGGFESNTNGWIAYTVGSASISQDTAQEKFGSASLQVVTGGLAVGEGAATGTNGTIGLPGVTNHTVSAWVRGTGTVILSVREYDSTNSFLQQQNSGPVTLTSSWQRVTLSFTSHANAALGDVLVTTNSSQATTFWVDGIQLEQLPIATPYVETAGSPTLRNHARLRGPSAVLDEAQSWVAFRIRPQVVSNNCFGTGVVRLFEWAEDDANRILLSYSCTSSRFEAHRIDNNFATVPLVNASYNAGDNLTVIMAWTATQVKLSVNGSAFTVQAGSFIPDLSAISQFDLGSSFGINSFLNGEIVWFAAGTGNLTDADPPLINGFGSTDPNMASFGAPAATTIVWQARTANYFDSNFQPIIMNVQNSLGTSLFSIDANDSAILLPGATSSSAALIFGNDVNLYRTAASQLRSDGSLGLGIAPTNGRIQVLGTAGQASDGIYFATDTNLYRAGVGILKTDSSFRTGGSILIEASSGVTAYATAGTAFLRNFLLNTDTQAAFNVGGDGRIEWGAGGSSVRDTNLYRSAANTLRTDDNFIVQTATNSTAAFQVQSAAGTNVLVVDTINGRVGIGTSSGIPTSGLALGPGKSFAMEMQVPSGVSASPAAGGSLTSGTYYFRVTASADLASTDSTTGSTEVSCTVDGATTNRCVITWPRLLLHAASYRIYKGASSGNQDRYQVTPQCPLATCTFNYDTDSGATLGSVPSTTDAFSTRFFNNGQASWIAANGNLTVGAKGNGGNTLYVAGTGRFQTTTDSTTAFQIQNAAATSLFIADTVNLRITLGSPTDTPVILVLGTKNTSGDPTCTNGGIYYNSDSNQFRGCANNAWNNLGGDNVVTTVPTTNLYDGRRVVLRAGASPYELITLVYDATKAKWVSPVERISPNLFRAGTNASFNYNGSWGNLFSNGVTPEIITGNYHSIYSAGLRLEARLIAQVQINGGVACEFRPSFQAWTENVSGLRASYTGTSTGATPSTNGTYFTRNDWEEVAIASAAGDVLEVDFEAMNSGVPSANNYIFNLTVEFRWVSQ